MITSNKLISATWSKISNVFSKNRVASNTNLFHPISNGNHDLEALTTKKISEL